MEEVSMHTDIAHLASLGLTAAPWTLGGPGLIAAPVTFPKAQKIAAWPLQALPWHVKGRSVTML